jgi:putative ABC transport system permease protein
MSWSRFFRRKRWDTERAEELESYLETETADNIARGMPEAEARATAHRKLGNPTRIREQIYRMNTLSLVDTLWQDLRYATRLLRKTPGFTLVAVLSLALGIGANSAVFSVIYAVLLRPLPYPDAELLVSVGTRVTHGAVTMPHYEFWKEHTPAFAAAAGYRGGGSRSLAGDSGRQWVKVMSLTTDFFRTLGVPLAMGREFNAAETMRGGPQAIVLTDVLWRSAFGADPLILGRSVRLDDASHIVTGVLPPAFWFPQAADAFLPLRATGSISDRGTNTLMIARLKPGVSRREAEAAMPAVFENFRRVYPEIIRNDRNILSLTPFQEWLVGDVRLNLLLLFGAVGLLLLISCFNLASLLLARLAARQKEIAMRLALGSSRSRLVVQFLIESTLITLAGALAGLLGARALLGAIVALIPYQLHTSAPIRLDTPVLAFAAAIAFATGMAFSLLPLVTASRLDLQETLKAGGRLSGSGVRQRARNVLVVGQIALSVTLLVAAGLLIQSLYRLHQERLGFRPQGLTTFATPMPVERRRNPAEMWRFESTLLDRLRSLPGVRSVAVASVLPLDGFNNFPAEREGHPENSIGAVEIRAVTPAFFDVMGIPARRGRAFLETDIETAPAVILANETLARLWWPNGNPLGDRIVIGRFRGKDYGSPVPREVVGIVGDTKTTALKDPPRPTVYVPAAQMPDFITSPVWVLRAVSSAGLSAAIRRAVAELDPLQRVVSIRSMEEIVASTTARSRFDAWLFGALAGLALLLTSIGVYGLLSFSVARRTGEIGTRIALGAGRPAVLAMILRQGISLVLVGLMLGLAGAFAVTRALATLLYGVSPTDPISYLGVSVLLLAVGFTASYLPARRATRVDPLVALREE